MRRSLVLISMGAMVAACGPEAMEPEVETGRAIEGLELTNFGSNPGALKMWVTLPSRPTARPGLVVALHGCTQTAAEYANAGWNTYAERFGFYVLYPEVTSGVKCFGWYESSNTSRGFGQAASIAQAVSAVQSRYGIDASKIFVTGLSAGGGMTASLLAAYPDVFSAGATMAGLPAGCASSIGGSGSCQGGLDKTPDQWSALVRSAAPSNTTRWPRVAVWNGDNDFTVNVKNLTELMEQWTDVNGIDQTVDATTTVGRGTRREYRDASGRTLVETWTISGMGHGTAVAPGSGCGSTGAFLLDVGLCSTEWAVKFFGLDDGAIVNDAGVVIPDAGVVVPDAGTVRPDAGTPRPDAGVIIPDAGPVIPDAGTVVDAGVRPDAGTPVPVDAGTTTPTCVEANDTNYNLVAQGKASRCGQFNGYACAGSTQLGLWNTFYRSWVKSLDGTTWQAGRCQ